MSVKATPVSTMASAGTWSMASHAPASQVGWSPLEEYRKTASGPLLLPLVCQSDHCLADRPRRPSIYMPEQRHYCVLLACIPPTPPHISLSATAQEEKTIVRYPPPLPLPSSKCRGTAVRLMRCFSSSAIYIWGRQDLSPPSSCPPSSY